MDVFLACSDLMTSSRIELQCGIPLRRMASEPKLRAAMDDTPDCAVVVDLTAFPDLPKALRNDGFSGPIVGFAPHVREDLIEAATPSCDAVLPRGAVARRLSEALGIRSVSITDDVSN